MSGQRFAIKVLGASAAKADANLYLDDEKIGEVVIRLEPDADAVLYRDILGERFVLEAPPAECPACGTVGAVTCVCGRGPRP